MTAFSKIIESFGSLNEGNLTHHKPFLNQRSGNGRSSWYNRRKYGI